MGYIIDPTTDGDARKAARPARKPTQQQRRLLEHVAANTGRLRDYANRRDFPISVARRDVIWRCRSAGWIDAPVSTPTRTYELTELGRAALLSDGGAEQPSTKDGVAEQRLNNPNPATEQGEDVT